MASTVIAGKPSNTVGDKDSVLVLRGSSVKILWGNKFIDLIKNGKINSEYEKILKSVDLIETVKGDGIYLVKDQVWLVLNNTKVQLSGNSSTVYVSFVDALETSKENKLIALKNIGFYYNTLEEAKQQGLSSGIIYVLGDNKLYTIIDGKFLEYSYQSLKEAIVEDALQQLLYIDLYSLWVGEDEYIKCDNDSVSILKQLITKEGIYSLGSTSTYGYRLYMEHGKSILEIDEIIERNPKYINVDIPHSLYTSHNNIVERVDTTEDDLICVLQEDNKYKLDEYIYIYTYPVIEDSYSEGVVTINISVPLPYELNIIINNDNITIPENTEVFTVFNILRDYIISYPKLLRILREYKILLVNGQKITIDVPQKERKMFIQNCKYLYDARNPYIEIENNNLKVLDRGEKSDNTIHTKIGIIDLIEELKIEESVETLYVRPEVGIYSDNFQGLNPVLYNAVFDIAGKKDKDTLHHKYPKYSSNIILPEKDLIFDKRFDQVTPNIEWIKQILDFCVPIGTIVMWHGTTIPEGWAMCNGNNGTPDLRNRFIKGSENSENSGAVNPAGVIILDGVNKFQIKEEHLPEHHHEHKAHSHYISLSTDGEYTLTSSSSVSSILAVAGEGITVSPGYSGDATSGSTHYHSVTGNTQTATSLELDKTWTNSPITIEPLHYNMIFIMKIKNYVNF